MGTMVASSENPVLPDAHVRHIGQRPRGGTVLADLHGNIRYCCPDFAALVGLPAAAVVERPIRSFLPGLPLDARTAGYNVAWVRFRERDGCREPYDLALGSGAFLQVTVECKVVRLLREAALLLNVWPSSRIAQGSPGAAIAEAAATAPCGVLIVDGEGVIEHVNPAFEQISGHARHEFIGRRPILMLRDEEGRCFDWPGCGAACTHGESL